MMKMVNKQRVQRIKNLIYAFLILMMFLPLVLMSILSFQMFNAIKGLNARVDSLSKFAASQAESHPPASSSAPDSGYVIEPEKQSSEPGGSDGQEPDSIQNQGEEANSDSLDTDKPDISPDGGNSLGSAVQGAAQSAGGGNELGGGAPIDPSNDGYLAAANADASNSNTQDNTANAAQGELATNPQMGYDSDVPSSDYNSNPSTGS